MKRFYQRLFFRQCRLGGVRIFCVAVSVVCAAVFSSTLLSDRLERFFAHQSKEILASDLVFESSTLPTEAQRALIAESPLKKAQTLSFRTMLSVADQFLLVSVKAVSPGYPLRGELQISDLRYGVPHSIKRGPRLGEVWLEDRVLQALDLSIGESLRIGERSFRISYVLVFEPDRGGSFYSFTPRVMMHRQDVVSTEIIQPGSRVHYRYLFSGETKHLRALKVALTSGLLPNQRFVSVEEAHQSLDRILRQIQRFFHIGTLLALLLGIIGVALASYQYGNELEPEYAVLRCLGLSGRALRTGIILPLLGFAIFSFFFGLLLGGGIHVLILRSLGDLVPAALPPPGRLPFFLTGCTVLGVVMIFSWPLLQRLSTGHVQDLLDRAETRRPVSALMFVVMVLGLFTLIVISSRDLFWSASASGLFFLLAGLFYSLLQWLLKYWAKHPPATGSLLGLSVRLLAVNRRMIGLQIVAVTLSLFAVSSMSTLSKDLVAAWHEKIPDGAPNFFVINLSSKERARFSSILQQEKIPHSPFYPIVRGRLSAVNGESVRDYASKESGRHHDSLRRDLSLSATSTLPKGNRVLQGTWHDGSKHQGQAEVSVEKRLADKLEIKLGDILQFSVGTEVFLARVTSLRSVDWESFTPNFYMLFAPGDLDDFPTTYLASLYLEEVQKRIMPTLIRQFPAASFFDVTFLLTRIRGIIARAEQAIQALLWLSVLASLVVFLSVEMILQRTRQYSIALLKALGAGTRLVGRIFKIQSLGVGLSAGCLAYLLNLTVGSTLAGLLIETRVFFNPKTALFCLLVAPLFVYAVAHFSLHQNCRNSVYKLFGERAI